MKLFRVWLLLAVGLAVLAPPLPLPPAHAANGVVNAPCNEAAFDTVLNNIQSTGGGTLTFNCGITTSIIFSVSKTITSTVTINGGGVMTLSGGNTTRHFYVAPGAALTLTRVTVSHGYANADGGAIYNDNGRLMVDQSTFRDNQTTLAGSGGAIVSYGPLTITASLFEDNQGGGAGAVYPRFSGAVTYIANSTFRYNQAAYGGGALGSWDGAPMTILDSQFISNTADTGGAIYNFGPALIRNSLVLSNTTTGPGGGLYNVSTLHLDGVTVRGNTVTSGATAGGGLYNTGTAVITGTTFSANSAAAHGTIRQVGTLTLTNSTLYATYPASVLGAWSSSATFLRFVTIVGVGSGALIHNDQGNISLRSVLLSHLGTDDCFVVGGSPPIISEGNNLSSDASCNLTQPNDHPNTPALLGPLTNNGGPTQTLAPQPGSEAIDEGTCQGYAPTDQRGVARPQGPACDIGAVEVAPWRLFLPLVVR